MSLDDPGADTLAELALPRVVLISSAGDEVGRAAAVAALATVLAAHGRDVGAAQTIQTGRAAGAPGDADLIAQLSDVPTQEWSRVHAALPPVVAAQREGVALTPAVKHALRAAETEHDTLLVVGTGGLLTPLDARGGTLADMGTALRYKGVSTGCIVIVTAGPTALATVALIAESLAARDLPLLGVVIAEWPADPDDAQLVDLQQLPAVSGARLLGVVPCGADDLDPLPFRSQALRWFSPATWDTMSS